MRDETSPTYRFGEMIAIGNADSLAAELIPLCGSPHLDRITLNTEHVVVCDLYGVEMLLKVLRKAEQSGKQLVLQNPSQSVRDTLRTAGILDLFARTCTDEQD